MRRSERRRLPTREDVAELYRVLLGREPDSDEAVALKTTRPWPDLVLDFVTSDEFKRRWDPHIASADDVAHLYRIFHGREPDSPDAVQRKLSRPWPDLVADFVSSDEFRRRTKEATITEMFEHAVTFTDDVDARREVIGDQFRTTQEQWTSAGSAERTAYWSILTEDTWRGDIDEEDVRAFYESGKEDVEFIHWLAEQVRPGFDFESARVLDFGCGVGRHLLHMLDEASWCEGWDLSRSHIDLLERNLDALYGIDRARYGVRVLDSIDVAQPEPSFDFAYSILALQHSPPQLMAHIVREILRSVRRGGLAALHIPTVPLLEPIGGATAVYAIPKDAIFRIAAEESAMVRLSRYANFCGPTCFNEWFVFERG